jgi:hypothetical protein
VPATVTDACIGGQLGHLFVGPEGNADRVAVKIVLGVDTPAENCTPANQYRGCIVARRLVRYAKHATLVLPVALRVVCDGIGCDETTTCAEDATCESSLATCDDGGTCRTGSEARAAELDAGGTSGGGSSGTSGGSGTSGQDGAATSDGAAGDGGGGLDGGGGDEPLGHGTVTCFGSTCDLDQGMVCCVDSRTSGHCTAPADCPSQLGTFRCDGPEDCAHLSFGRCFLNRDMTNKVFTVCRTDNALAQYYPVCHSTDAIPCLAGSCDGFDYNLQVCNL